MEATAVSLDNEVQGWSVVEAAASPVTLIGHEIRNGKKQSPITVIGHEIRNGKGQSPATELSLQKYALLKANCLWTESSPGAVCFHAHAPALPCSRPARAHALLMPYLAHWQKADIKMFLILAKVGLVTGRQALDACYQILTVEVGGCPVWDGGHFLSC
eukprot:scaffold247309_cov21-Tisochrysis_lutea.AAC.1